MGPAGLVDAARAFEVAAGERADGDERVHAGAGRDRADLAVVGGGARAQLGHVPEDGDGAAAGGALGEVLERGGHRERVRVVGVVDEEAVVGKLRLLPAPARQRDLRGALARPRERQAERAVGAERGEDVLGVVARREGKLERNPLAEDRHLDGRGVAARRERDELDVAVWAEANHLDVLAVQVRLEQRISCGDDRRSAGRKRADQLGLRLRDALERREQLEVHGPDLRDHADLAAARSRRARRSGRGRACPSRARRPRCRARAGRA